MRDGWHDARLGDLITRVRRPVEVHPDASYAEIGIRSFGRGVFQKEPVTGAALGNKKIFEVREGDLVFNIVFAWEGAVAIVSPADDGRVGSHRFPTYRAVHGQADVRFLRYFFETHKGRALLSDVSPGSAGRNRTLNQGALLDSTLPVPDLEAQLELVALSEALERAESAAQRHHGFHLEVRRALARELLEAHRAEAEYSVGEVATLRSGKYLAKKDHVEGGAVPVFGANGSIGAYDRANAAAGTTVIGRVGSCGAINLLREDAWVSDNAICASPEPDRLLPAYFAMALDAVDFEPLKSGAVQPLITQQTVSGIIVPVPSLEAQQEAVSLFEDATRCVEMAATQVEHYGQVKSALLNDAFDGSRPSSAVKVPAEAALVS